MKNEIQIDELPGYPHYPPEDDISSNINNNGKLRFDEDEAVVVFSECSDDKVLGGAITAGTDDDDVSDDDLQTLEYAAQHMTDSNFHKASLDSKDNEGDLLEENGSLNRNTTGDTLDVPGGELDDVMEQIGAEDEENNFYSLGSDINDALEENEF
jgi:hypothetical protein